MASLQVVPVLDGLRAWAAACPDDVLFVWLRRGEEAERVTFGQLFSRAGGIAQTLLRDWGVRPGDRVLLVYPPTGLEFVAALFGCLRAGVVAVPAYPPDPNKVVASQAEALLRVARVCGAKVALTDSAYSWVAWALQLRHPALRALRWRSTSRVGGRLAFHDPVAHLASDTAFLQFSSGSTGAPKGVAVTHGCLAHNCALARRSMRIDAACCECSWLPVYHDMGLVGGVLTALTVPPPYCAAPGQPGQSARAVLRQCPCVLMSPLDFLADPLCWPRALSRYRATHTQAPDFAYALCAERAAAAAVRGVLDVRSLDLSSLRVALCGAETARPETKARFCEVFCDARMPTAALVAGYGLAEHTVYVCDGGQRVLCCARDAMEREPRRAVPLTDGDHPHATVRLLSCGRPPPEVQLRIVDPHALSVLPDGCVGEIWLASDSVAAGYVGASQELEAATFGATLAGDVTAAAHLRTGDLGFLDQGELFFVGRSKDTMVLRGRNLAPEDLERAAILACAALRPGCAAAFAVETLGGCNARVVLVAEVRDAGTSATVAAALAAQVRAAVSAAHGVTLTEVVLLPPRCLPKTTSGKVRRFMCRQLFLDGTLPTLHASSAAPHGAQQALAARLLLQDGPDALAAMSPVQRRAELCRRVVCYISAAWGIQGMRPHTDILAAGLDSAGAAALQGALEGAFGVALPPTLLLDARTPAALAAAVDQARWADADWDDAASWKSRGDAASEHEAAQRDVVPPPPRTPFQRLAGALLLLFCAAMLIAHGVSMGLLRLDDGSPLCWWTAQSPELFKGPGFKPGWLPGSQRKMDVSHWRLVEWARTVAPVHILLNGPAALLTVFCVRALPGVSPRSVTACWGLAHAAALHGVWSLPLMMLSLLSFATTELCKSRPRALRVAAWLLILLPMGYFNCSEPGNLAWSAVEGRLGVVERGYLRLVMPHPGVRPFAGLLGGSSFTANRTFRYLALRLLSYSLDLADDKGRRQSGGSTFERAELFLAYVFFAPLYLCGPVLTFAQFASCPAAAAATAGAKRDAAVHAPLLFEAPPAEETATNAGYPVDGDPSAHPPPLRQAGPPARASSRAPLRAQLRWR